MIVQSQKMQGRNNKIYVVYFAIANTRLQTTDISYTN